MLRVLTSTKASPWDPMPALLAQSRACRVSRKSGVLGVTCVPSSLKKRGFKREEAGLRAGEGSFLRRPVPCEEREDGSAFSREEENGVRGT